jgi:hypothetical protein
MGRRGSFALTILVLMLLACGLASPTGQTTQPASVVATTTNSPVSASTPPAIPVSISTGLSSLSSYRMTLTIKSSGPDPSQGMTVDVQLERSNNPDASHTHYDLSLQQKAGSEPQATNSDLYQIGDDTCSGANDSWDFTHNSSQQAEMLELVQNMIGLDPLIESPTFVAQEMVNGVPTNHFTFKVSGLGQKSGAQVDTDQGDYWLAVDGQYIVRYDLVLETSMAPNTSVMHEEISIDLDQINQPVTITFPTACQDQESATLTP